MHSISASAALAAALVPLVSANLDKPVIDPPFPNGGLDSLTPGLTENLQPAGSTSDDWDPNWLPEDCKNIAEGSNFNALDIEAFNIHYDDCPDDPWVFCRHKDAPLSKDDMIDAWARLPVHMRSYVRHIISLPGDKSAGSNGDNVQINGPCQLTVYIHEVAHSMDSHAFDESLGAPFSNSQVWLDAYNQDSAVTDDYGQSSQQENFAQQTVVALFDKVVPGGVNTIQPNSQAIMHQYTAVQDNAGDEITPGGTCTHRLPNSNPVSKSNSAKFRVSESTKPDVSLSNKVKALKAIPMTSSMKLTKFDDAGKPIGSRVVKLNV